MNDSQYDRASGLPSGTITFVFTDIEGSTRRWEAFGDLMGEAVRRHDRVVRCALETTGGGHVFKMLGDGFCVAFADPSDAVVAAIDVQRALADEDFSAVDGVRVRIAMHTGSAEERDGDYFGPTLNRVARLLGVGHGGQILLSAATQKLIATRLPCEATLRDLGEQQLKDLVLAERVYQVVLPDIRSDFPRLLSLNELPNNLPHQISSFIGREADIAFGKTLIAESRFVSLVGTGGVGKTRFALQLGAELLDHYRHGVWFVELAAVDRPSFLLGAIAQAIGVQPSIQPTLSEALVDYLNPRTVLLIVDNCEHLIGEVARIAETLLSTCPNLSILATSREPLRIAGERVYRMPSLSVPPEAERLTAKEALGFEAIALFVERAGALDARFRFTDREAPIVADICRRLDGIALAIELAAARVRVLGTRRLMERLHDRFRTLTVGDRTALPRQQTLRALIDWSYELLDEAERAVFRRLAVFANGFTLEAATVVGAGGEVAPEDVLDLLAALVDKSLIVVEFDSTGAEPRYHYLELLREYALDKLAGVERHAARRAFASWVLAFARRAHADWETEPSANWEEQVRPENLNLRAALAFAFGEDGDAEFGLSIAAASRRIWGRLAPLEGVRWVGEAFAHVTPATPRSTVASLELASAQLQIALGRYAVALAAAERAGQLFENDAIGQTAFYEARGFAGYALVAIGRADEGEALLTEALAHYRQHGARQLAAHAVSDLAIKYCMSSDLEPACRYLREAFEAFRSIQNQRGAISTGINLAEIEFQSGNVEAAIEHARRAFDDDPRGRDASAVLANLTAYTVALGRWDDARDYARLALNVAKMAPEDRIFAFAMQHIAALAALRPKTGRAGLQTDFEVAATLLGYVDATLARLEASREDTETLEYQRLLELLPIELSASRCAELTARGARLTPDQALDAALTV